ncbi:MAG: site-specific integrase, partial [Candidatus Gottesmanbacteria bacterium]
KRALIVAQTPTATINRRLSALRMFFQFAVIEQKITENPTLLVRNISRIDATNNASILNKALTEYTSEMKITTADIDDIKTFFSWYYNQYIS